MKWLLIVSTAFLLLFSQQAFGQDTYDRQPASSSSRSPSPTPSPQRQPPKTPPSPKLNPRKREDNYSYSYSGADCRVYVFPGVGRETFLLNSLATASISIHEAKAPVRTLGRKAVVGFTESIRTIAGSLVFTIIKNHPLSDINHKDNKNKQPSGMRETNDGLGEVNQLSTLLNPVNLYFIYKAENEQTGAKADMTVKGVRFINEGIVTSINDMVTEVVMQFVAEDVDMFDFKGWKPPNRLQLTPPAPPFSSHSSGFGLTLLPGASGVGELTISHASDTANGSK